MVMEPHWSGVYNLQPGDTGIQILGTEAPVNMEGLGWVSGASSDTVSKQGPRGTMSDSHSELRTSDPNPPSVLPTGALLMRKACSVSDKLFSLPSHAL